MNIEQRTLNFEWIPPKGAEWVGMPVSACKNGGFRPAFRGTDYEAARQRRPTLRRVANGYTSFHHAGFSTIYLRGKTYGNVFVVNCYETAK